MTITEKLYLTSWEYNAALIILELAKIIEKNGGKIVPYYKNTIIINRSLKSEVIKYESHIEKLTDIQKQNYKPEKENLIKNLKQKLAELKEYENNNNLVLIKTSLTYIRFVLNGDMYYYQLNDNPFFDFYYDKTPIKNNQYSLDTCMEKDNKEWLYDYHLSYKCTDTQRREAAKNIFEMLLSAKFCSVIRNTEKKRVSNTYNDGYHYEIVIKPERMKSVDF